MTAEIVVAIGLIAIIAAILVTGLVLAFRAGKDADTKKEAKELCKLLDDLTGIHEHKFVHTFER